MPMYDYICTACETVDSRLCRHEESESQLCEHCGNHLVIDFQSTFEHGTINIPGGGAAGAKAFRSV